MPPKPLIPQRQSLNQPKPRLNRPKPKPTETETEIDHEPTETETETDHHLFHDGFDAEVGRDLGRELVRLDAPHHPPCTRSEGLEFRLHRVESND